MLVDKQLASRLHDNPLLLPVQQPKRNIKVLKSCKQPAFPNIDLLNMQDVLFAPAPMPFRKKFADRL